MELACATRKTHNTKIQCNGSIEIGNRTFHCWWRKGHGATSTKKALATSCDIFFYQIALQLSMQDLIDISEEFMLDIQHNTLPIKSSYHKAFKKYHNYNQGDVIVNTIGQGHWQISPLGILNIISTIANNGVINPLYIVKNIKYNNINISPKNSSNPLKVLDYPEEDFQLVKSALRDSVRKRYGTSWYMNTHIPNWGLSAKTGTAQIVTLDSEYKDIKRNRDNSLAVGFLPYHNPKYAITIILEHEGFAAMSIPPIMKSVVKALKDRDSLY